jgi:hypothetical protein
VGQLERGETRSELQIPHAGQVRPTVPVGAADDVAFVIRDQQIVVPIRVQDGLEQGAGIRGDCMQRRRAPSCGLGAVGGGAASYESHRPHQQGELFRDVSSFGVHKSFLSERSRSSPFVNALQWRDSSAIRRVDAMVDEPRFARMHAISS